MRHPEKLVFESDDRGEVVERMSAMAGEHVGWLNFEPELAGESEQGASLFGFLVSSGPETPMCTWKPGRKKKGAVEPTSIGVQHNAGPKVVAHLANLGLELPGGWRVVQDHPKRGLVALVPPDAALDEVLEWLMRAAERLSERSPTGRWLAHVYR